MTLERTILNKRLSAMHVIPGLALRHGGPSYSVPKLCETLRPQGVDSTIHTVATPDMITGPLIRAHRQDYEGVPLLTNLRFSRSLRRAAFEEAKTSDLIHVHGLWLMPNIYAGAAAARSGRPLIISPRGMLGKEALKFSSLKKKAFWIALQNAAYREGSCWHATSHSEASEIRDFGIQSPIAVIPNGIDIPELAHTFPKKTGQKSILFLGRLHPIKGVDLLIQAWKRIAEVLPAWHLQIAGPDEGGYRQSLEALISQYRIPRVQFLGPVAGAEKTELLRNSDLVVLPSRFESFGVVVAEALSHGIPVLASRGTPWSGVVNNRCGWWPDASVEALAGTCTEATSLSSRERREMGLRGRRWVMEAFSWAAVAAQMKDLYCWTVREGLVPKTVALR